MNDGSGPYLLSELRALQKAVLGGLSLNQRTDIEFIALNGGVSTYLPFGRRMVLGKLSSDYQGAWWYPPRDTHHKLLYSIADSIKLLNTPYPYSTRQFSEIRASCTSALHNYVYPYTCKHHSITDEILLCYLELCKKSVSLYRGQHGFGNCYVYPEIIKVYFSVSEKIKVQGFKHAISNYTDLAAAFRSVPVFFKEHIFSIRGRE
jgi:hypothetical protein